MIHILRILVGTIMFYLFICWVLVVPYIVDDEADSSKYIKIPGIICWIIILSIPILIVVYVLGSVFIR